MVCYWKGRHEPIRIEIKQILANLFMLFYILGIPIKQN